MKPVSAIIMLAGIHYGAMYGGSTTSILVNIPGEAASGERVQYMSGEDFEKWWDQDYQKVGALLKQLIKK